MSELDNIFFCKKDKEQLYYNTDMDMYICSECAAIIHPFELESRATTTA